MPAFPAAPLPYLYVMSRPRQHRLALQACLILTLAGAAPQAAGAEPVDVELILAVDVSLSMSPAELAI